MYEAAGAELDLLFSGSKALPAALCPSGAVAPVETIVGPTVSTVWRFETTALSAADEAAAVAKILPHLSVLSSMHGALNIPLSAALRFAAV